MDGLKYSWRTFRDGNLIRWSLIYNVAMIFASLLDLALFFVVFSLLFGWTFEQYIKTDANLPLISLIAGLWLVPRFFMAAMRAAQIKTVGKAPGIIDWAHLAIRKMLVNIFCWYDKKLLIPAVLFIGLSVVLIGLTIAGIEPLTSYGMAIVFLLLTALAWGVGIVVHTIRTIFADYMYLRGEGDLVKMPRRSYDAVVGKTFEVFLAFLVFGLLMALFFVVIIIAMVALALIPVVGTIVDLILGAALLIAFSAFTQVFMVDMFKFFVDRGKKLAATKTSAVKKSASRKKSATKKKPATKKRKRRRK